MNKKIFFLTCLLILLQTVNGQTKPPSGAAYNAVLKAYISKDVKALEAAYPALAKAYPTDPYVKFFHAWINDQSGADIEAALREYSEVIRLAPDITDAYVYRSLIFWNKGMDDRAIADITKAIEIDGEQSPAYYFAMRGDFNNSSGNYKAAMEDFKTGIKLAPTHPKNYRGFMNVAIKANAVEEAEILFRSALNGDQQMNGDVRIVYADLLLRMKRFTEADAEYSKAFSVKDFNPSGNDVNGAAIAALNLKDFDRAVVLSERSIAIDPKNVDLYNNRANIAVNMLQWEDVYKWAQKALAVNDKSPHANMLMAVGIKRTGRGDALSAEYQAKAKRLEAEGN